VPSVLATGALYETLAEAILALTIAAGLPFDVMAWFLADEIAVRPTLLEEYRCDKNCGIMV